MNLPVASLPVPGLRDSSAVLPPVTKELTTIPKFPRLSIFNKCILDPIPPPIQSVIAKGVYHVNLIKIVTINF